jgi:hypothetical protein
MVKRKNEQLEAVQVKWMDNRRIECLPVSGKMFHATAEATYTVLQDCFEDKDGSGIGTPMSFSTSWFDAFKKRHRIVYCQLRGEAGSVDLDMIEPELAKIRQLCAKNDPENIYNCDETGLYLRELNSKSYTTTGNIAGAKAD